MTIDNNRVFIENKLNEIGSAVMYSQSNSVSRLPNDVVNFVRLDDCGQLWFTGHKPRNWVRTYEQSFPARLFFYRKGVEFYVETTGTARIVNGEERSPAEDPHPGSVLYKMSLSNIEYVETGKKHEDGHQHPASQFYHWLLHVLALDTAGMLRFSAPQKTKRYE